MKTIYKYEIDIHDKSIIHVPRNSILLDIQLQGDSIMAWFIVDIDAEIVGIEFEIYGTGYNIETNKLLYLKTVKTHNDFLVWHIFMNPGQDIELQFPRL